MKETVVWGWKERGGDVLTKSQKMIRCSGVIVKSRVVSIEEDGAL